MFAEFTPVAARISVIDVGDSLFARLTRGNALDTDPVWSPDGRRIAFGRLAGIGGGIYVMNVDGTGLTRLTHDNRATERSPAWQPATALAP